MKDEYFAFLDDLCKSGTPNMYGAVKHLQSKFPELKASGAPQENTPSAQRIFDAWLSDPYRLRGGICLT